MKKFSESEKNLHKIKDLICIINFIVEDLKEEGRIFLEEEENILDSTRKILEVLKNR